MKFFFSLKTKLSLLFVIIFGGGLLMYSVYIYRAVVKEFQIGFDVQLYDFSMDVRDSINYSFLKGLRFDTRPFVVNKKVFPFTMRESVMQIRSASGALMASSKGLMGQELPFSPQIHERVVKGEYHYANWHPRKRISKSQSFRVLTRVIQKPLEPKLILQVAVPDRYVKQNSKRIYHTFLYSIPILLLVSGVIGYIFTGLSLQPVMRIIARVRKIQGKDLQTRVPVPQDGSDEVYQLAITINQMLERVEKAFVSQERFVSDASHQLKTPLAVLKGELEELSRIDPGKDEANQKINSLREEVDLLIALVNNLLLLARVDAGDRGLVFSEVALDEVVSVVCSRLAPLAKKKSVTLQLNLGEVDCPESQHPFDVSGDYDLLVSLFQSLLENAIKYSPVGSKIEILVKDDCESLRVEILDQGPGINVDQLNSLYDRFTRGNEARGISGSGLGLSIAKRISEIHSGDLILENRSDSRGLAAIIRIKKL